MLFLFQWCAIADFDWQWNCVLNPLWWMDFVMCASYCAHLSSSLYFCRLTGSLCCSSLVVFGVGGMAGLQNMMKQLEQGGGMDSMMGPDGAMGMGMPGAGPGGRRRRRDRE